MATKLKYPPECFSSISRNIMTPNIEGYYKLRKGFAELSSGTGIYNEPIFGVTIRENSDFKSKLFFKMSDALNYIEELL